MCPACAKQGIFGIEICTIHKFGLHPSQMSGPNKYIDEKGWREEDTSFDEFLASDPSEEFRNRGNSSQGKEQTMITVQRNNVPQQGKTQARGVQFLKPIHVPTTGVKAQIYKATSDKPDNFGNPYVVYFQFNGGKYSKGFKPTSDNLATLVDLLGADETKWAKKTVTITRLVDDEGAERIAFSAGK